MQSQQNLQQPLQLSKLTYTSIIDSRGLGRFHYFILFIYALILCGEGSTRYMISIINQVLKKEWNLTTDQQGFLGTSFYVGYFISQLFIGPLADKIGRKNPFIFVISLSVVVGIATAFMQEYWSFCVSIVLLAFLQGCGVPLQVAWLTEVSPTWFRGISVTFGFIIFFIGGIYICLMSLWLTPNLEPIQWRELIIFSSAPYFIPLILLFFVPESPLYLATKRRHEEAIQAYQKIIRFNKQAELSPEEIQLLKEGQFEETYIIEEEFRSQSIWDIFNKDHLKTTLILSYLWFTWGFVVYGFTYILPETLDSLPTKPENLVTTYMIKIYVALPSQVLAIIMMEMRCLGRIKSIIICFILQTMFVSFCAFLNPDEYFIFFASMANFFASMVSLIVYPYSSEYYPTYIRLTGFSFVSCWARLAGMLSPFLCYQLHGMHINAPYLVFFMVSVLAIACSFLLEVETIDRPLDSKSKKVKGE